MSIQSPSLQAISLFLALSLTLSSPVFALRQLEPAQNAGLEQALSASLDHPTSAAGLEEETAVAQIKQRLVQEGFTSERFLNHLLNVEFDDGTPNQKLVKDEDGEWWLHMHLISRAGNGLLFHLVLSPGEGQKIVGLDRPMAEPYFQDQYISLAELTQGYSPALTDADIQRLIEKAYKLVLTLKEDFQKAIRMNQPVFVLGRAVDPPRALGLYAQLDAEPGYQLMRNVRWPPHDYNAVTYQIGQPTVASPTAGMEESAMGVSGRVPVQTERLLRELFGSGEAVRDLKAGLEEADAGQRRFLIRFEQNLLPGNSPAEKLAHLSAVQGNLESDLGLSKDEIMFGLTGPLDATLKYMAGADVEIQILRQPGSSLEATFSDPAILYVATQALSGVLIAQEFRPQYEFYVDPAQSAGLEEIRYPDFSVGLAELFKAA